MLSTLHTQTQHWSIDWMPVCDAVIVSAISRMLGAVAAPCYHNPERSLLIVSPHVLRLKAAEFFRETSQCTSLKTPDYEMWNEHILSGIGLNNLDEPKIFIKKNVRNHPYHQFYLVLAKIWINWIQIKRGLLCLICWTREHLTKLCNKSSNF